MADNDEYEYEIDTEEEEEEEDEDDGDGDAEQEARTLAYWKEHEIAKALGDEAAMRLALERFFNPNYDEEYDAASGESRVHLALKNRLLPHTAILASLKHYREGLLPVTHQSPPSPWPTCRGPPGRGHGLMLGPLIYNDIERGKRVDCLNWGSCAPVPSNVDSVGDMESDALFLLLVDTEDAFSSLDRDCSYGDCFYHRFPCLIIMLPQGNGHPDVATLRFINKIRTHFSLPLFAHVDCDPKSLKLLSLYTSQLPDIKWLGIRPSDLHNYNILERLRLPMTEHDTNTVKDLLESDFVKENPRWTEELNIMLEMKHKVEIAALCSIGFHFVGEVFLPLKLQDRDWI